MVALDVERCGDHDKPLPCAACDLRDEIDAVWLGCSLAMAGALLLWVICSALLARFHP